MPLIVLLGQILTANTPALKALEQNSSMLLQRSQTDKNIKIVAAETKTHYATWPQSSAGDLVVAANVAHWQYSLEMLATSGEEERATLPFF